MSKISEKLKCMIKETEIGRRYRRFKRVKAIIGEHTIQQAIDKFAPSLPQSRKEELKKDILDKAKKYRFSAEEYFYYHFEDKSEDEIKSFVSDVDRKEFCEGLNCEKNRMIFDNKLKCADVFSKYYGRDFCGVSSVNDLQKLKEFTKKHKRFIFKPLIGSLGEGITILEKDWTDSDLENLISDNCGDGKLGFIAEELLVQVPEMAQFHPSSLNTIRVATVKFDEGVEVIAASLRTGRGGSIVDNAGAGGVFGTIDIETGTIEAVGDEFGNSYEAHPDTEARMVGFTIPRWQEAVELAKELATVVKGNRYAGWDLALTEKGWIMIEGNARGQFIWQISSQKGFKKEANKILKLLGLPQMTNTQIC